MLANVGGEIFAAVDVCPHAHQPISSGWVAGATIVCGHHGARFDLRSGEPLSVTDQRLQIRETKLSDGDVFVAIH